MVKMRTKNLMVFFFAMASVLLVVGFASALPDIATIDSIKIDDVFATGSEVAVEAGETITVKVFFTALENASDVRVKAEIEGRKIDVDEKTTPFSIEVGQVYVKTLFLTIPYELQDEVSEDLTLDIKIWNGDFRTEDTSIGLRVQRPSYNVGIMSLESPQTVGAGELFPLDVVLKNTGYNKLDDLYATVKIPALGFETSSYFGDLVAIEDPDYEDTEGRRLFVRIPYEAQAGLYTIEVEAHNADTVVSATKQIAIENDFVTNVFVTSTKKSTSVGSDAEFELVLTNPTNKLKVYRVIAGSTGEVSTDVSTELVAIPAGTSKTVVISATPESKGEHNFDVSVLSGEELVGTTTLSVEASGRSSSGGSIVALTIVLAIIFLVLVGVLIALLRRKPEQTEEFGESYY